MTTSIIHLAVGLVLLVAVNIVLGSLNALFDGSFDKVKLRNGIIKGIIVAACFIAFYMAGYLNPDIIAIEVDGQTVNLMTASNLALLTAYVLYAKDVFVKLKNLILSKTSYADLTQKLRWWMYSSSGAPSMLSASLRTIYCIQVLRPCNLTFPKYALGLLTERAPLAMRLMVNATLLCP